MSRIPPKVSFITPYEYHEYPKWLHSEGKLSVLVQNEAEEAAALGKKPAANKLMTFVEEVQESDPVPKRRGRPARDK